MKKQITLLVVLGTFACCSVSKANITDASWWADGDVALVCNSWNYLNGGTLTMDGVQYDRPAHMVADITTDTPLDPSLTLSSSVNNETGFAWNGYQVNVVMSVPFSIVLPAGVNNPPFNDWFIAGSTPPSFQLSGDWAGFYMGTVWYAEGTPVGIGGELDFSYTVQFGSSTHYILTQEMIPMMVPVPEPSTLAVAGIGGLLLALGLRRNSRKGA